MAFLVLLGYLELIVPGLLQIKYPLLAYLPMTLFAVHSRLNGSRLLPLVDGHCDWVFNGSHALSVDLGCNVHKLIKFFNLNNSSKSL